MSGKIPVNFRPALKSETEVIAKLYRISSDGVADYIWSQLAEPGEDLLAVGSRRYRREESDFSYRNCTIAEVKGKTAGMLVAFPIFVDPDYVESDPVMKPFSILEEDNSYYICGIAFSPEFRGKGYGKQLMQLAEQQAREKGFTKLSLIVFEENRLARELYLKLGYREVAHERVVPHPLIKVEGNALLMVKQLQ